jgi:hypothetical protein
MRTENQINFFVGIYKGGIRIFVIISCSFIKNLIKSLKSAYKKFNHVMINFLIGKCSKMQNMINL